MLVKRHDPLNLDAAKLSQRMEHRGACSADNDMGDGAGAMVACESWGIATMAPA